MDRKVPKYQSFTREDTQWDWDLNKREVHVRKQSWFILTEHVVKTLVSLLGSDKTVEVFSGTGLLTYHLLQERPPGSITKAYDNRSYGRSNWDDWRAYKRPYAGSQKNCFMVPIKTFDSVIMTWPSYNKNHAYRIAKKMVKGQTLYYQGELQGGCCADDTFFEYLDEAFTYLPTPTRLLNSKIAQYRSIHDEWAVYIKN